MTSKYFQHLASAGLLSLVLAAVPAAAQFDCNAPTETFSNGIPAGWTVVDDAGTGLLWGGFSVCVEQSNYTGIDATTGLGGAACVSSSTYGAAAFDTTLVSPVFSLAGVPFATLDFNANYQDFETADLLDVDISTDGGTSWTTLVRWDEDHGAFRFRPGEHVRVDLAPFLGMSNLRVRWRYYDLTPGASDWYAQIDDARLRCSACGTLFADPLVDGGFEAGSPSTAWLEASSNFSTPLCWPSTCGTAGARTGDWWASFGGTTGVAETASLEQTVVIPQGRAWLGFFLWNPESSGNGTDALRVRVDGTPVLSIPESQALYAAGYARVVVDLTAYADGGSHVIRLETATSGSPAASRFFVDDVSLTTCEPAPLSLSVSDAVMDPEGHFGTKDMTFTVTLTPPAELQPVTVDYATVDGTVDGSARAPGDYQTRTGTLTFQPWDVTKTVDVPVVGETLDEAAEEIFNLNLSNPVNAGISDGEGVGTIVDDDTAVLNVLDVFTDEGNTGTNPMVFDVTLTPPADHEVTVVFNTTTGGAATPGEDYQAVGPVTLTFAPLDTSETVTVPIVGDIREELDEDVAVGLSNVTGGAQVNQFLGRGFIMNDDFTKVRIADVSIVEGDSGTRSLVFNVTLTNPSNNTVTVDYATSNGTATAPADYIAIPQTTLIYQPGETSKQVAVQIVGDLIDELDETFYVNLLNPQNAEIDEIYNPGFRAIGTIVDGDTSRISIGDVSKAEGNTGTNIFSFTVSIDKINSRNVTVQWATANGTATAPGDYFTASGTAIISAGLPTATVNVSVVTDTTYELNETFFVNLTNPVNATIVDPQAVGTIVNDDPVPGIVISDVTVGEGGTADAVFTVSLTNASYQAISVNYATADGTALAATDYVAVSGTKTIPAYGLSTTINVALRRDDLPELSERFFVNLSAPVNATLAYSEGVGTITDDDGALATYQVNSQANGCYVLADTWNLSPSDKGAIYPVKPFSLANKFDMTFKVSFGQHDLGGGGIVWVLTQYHALGGGDMGFDSIYPSLGVEMDTTANYAQDPPEDHIAVDQHGGACCHAGHPPVQASATSANIEDGLTHEFRVKRDPALGGRMDVWFDGSLRLSYYDNITSYIFGGNPTVFWGVTGANNSDWVPSPSNVISVCPAAVCIGDTATPRLLADDVQATERNNTAVFKVRLYCPRSQTVTVQYTTANGTALAGSDYVATSGTLTFAPGETEKTVTVTLVRDAVTEPAETFYLNLLNPSVNVATPDTQAAARITD